MDNQDPNDIAAKFEAFISSFAYDTLKIDVEILSKSWPAETLVSGPLRRRQAVTALLALGESAQAESH